MMPPMPQEPSRRDLRLILGVQGVRAFLAGALGALAAGGPAAFRHLFPGLPADQRFLLVFPAFAVVCAVLAIRVSPAVEGSVGPGGNIAPFTVADPARGRGSARARRPLE